MVKEQYEKFKKIKPGQYVTYMRPDMVEFWVKATDRIDSIDLSWEQNVADMRVGGIWVGMQHIIKVLDE